MEVVDQLIGYQFGFVEQTEGTISCVGVFVP